MAGAAVTRIVASRFSMNIAAATIQAAGAVRERRDILLSSSRTRARARPRRRGARGGTVRRHRA